MQNETQRERISDAEIRNVREIQDPVIWSREQKNTDRFAYQDYEERQENRS